MININIQFASKLSYQIVLGSMEGSVLNYFFLLLLLLRHSYSIPKKIYPPQNPSPRRPAPGPRIWLSSYSSTDSYLTLPADDNFRRRKYFENDYASKNLSDYILHEGTLRATFTCKEFYPVKWTLPFPNQVLELFNFDYFLQVTDYRESTFSESQEQPQNRAFASLLTLTIPNLNFFSANFTCISARKGPPKATPQSSIYVYADSSIHALEKQGQTLQVPISYPEDPHYILPCRPATPSIEVTLQKQMISKSNSSDNSSMLTWQEIMQSNYLSFDPKVGFVMDKRLLEEKVFGMYRCFAEDDRDGGDEADLDNLSVKLNVTQKESNDIVRSTDDVKEEFQPFSWTKGNASIIDGIKSHPNVIQCCSGVGNDAPKSVIVGCNGPMQCEIYKELIMEMVKSKNERSYGSITVNSYQDGQWTEDLERSDCHTNFIGSGETLLYCNGKTMQYLEDFVDILYPYMGSIEKRKELQEPDQKEPSAIYITYRVPNSNISSIQGNQKALIAVGYDFNSLLHPLMEHIRYTYFTFDDLNADALIDYSYNYDIQKVRDIMEFQRNYYYEGEPLVFMCFSIKHFYSSSTHLRLNWKNGTSTIIKSAYDNLRKEDIFIYFNVGTRLSKTGYGGFNFHPFIGKEINASLEMKSVDCFNPPWDSWEWEVIHYQVEVRSPVLTKFLGEEEKIVYFYLNDKDKEITFNILEGTPFPKLSLTRDGKSLLKKLEDEGVQDTLNGYNFTSNIDDFTDNWANTSASEISDKSYVVKVGFPIVTHDTQGVYQCTGENVKGRASQTIRVIVTTRRSHVAAVVIGVIAILLGVLLVGIGFFYKCQHRQVQNLRWGIIRL